MPEVTKNIQQYAQKLGVVKQFEDNSGSQLLKGSRKEVVATLNGGDKKNELHIQGNSFSWTSPMALRKVRQEMRKVAIALEEIATIEDTFSQRHGIEASTLQQRVENYPVDTVDATERQAYALLSGESLPYGSQTVMHQVSQKIERAESNLKFHQSRDNSLEQLSNTVDENLKSVSKDDLDRLPDASRERIEAVAKRVDKKFPTAIERDNEAIL